MVSASGTDNKIIPFDLISTKKRHLILRFGYYYHFHGGSKVIQLSVRHLSKVISYLRTIMYLRTIYVKQCAYWSISKNKIVNFKMIIFSNNIFVPRLADAGHLDYREVNHARVAIWTMIHFRKLNFFNFPSLIFDSSKLSLERLLHPPPPKECNRLLYCASKILIQINSN